MKIKYLLILVLVTFSCKSNTESLYQFDIGSIVESKFTLSEIAEEIVYIPLDNSYPMGIYHDIKITNNFIYISVYPDGILAFNRDGQGARKIGQKGKGPGEYMFSMCFTVDDHDQIYVLDPVVQKIKVYSNAGNFIRDFSIENDATAFFDIDFYNNHFFLSEYIQFGNANYNWIVIDSLGNLKSQKKNSIPTFKSNYGDLGGTYKYDNRIFYFNSYNDTVFSILPDFSVEASFLFSPGELRLSRNSIIEPGKSISGYMNVIYIFETKHYRVICYNYDSKKSIALIEKESNKSFLIKGRETNQSSSGKDYSWGIINDLDGGIMFQPENYHEEDGQEYMIELLAPFILKSYVASSEFKNAVPKYPEKKEELEKLANSLKETDNPILVMVRLKK